MKDTYIYPAVFIYEDDGISIVFPDLSGCVSFGKDETEAFYNAKEALGLHLFGMEQDNEEFPQATHLCDISLVANEKAVLVEVFMPVVREKINNRSVKKTLTIPAWLNAEAEQKNLNFSAVLQDALKDQLNING